MHCGAKNCALCHTVLVGCCVILRKALFDALHYLLYLQYTNAAFPAPILERTNAEHITYRQLTLSTMGRDSLVGIATRYGLDGPGIESRWEMRFSATVQTGPEAYPASYTMGTGFFPGVKRPGRGVDHPPPSNVEVKERVELYLYSPSGPSWPVLGRTLPLLYHPNREVDVENTAVN